MQTMNLQEYRNRKKPSKYHSEKTNGYDSRKEYRRAVELERLEQQGVILNLRKQVRYLLAPSQYMSGIKGKPVCVRRELSYVADFVYVLHGNNLEIVEDSKGFKTKEYLHKKRLMKLVYGIDIHET